MSDYIIPYFNFYATDFKALKDKLSKDDLWDIVDAMCDLCIHGESDYVPQNKFQEKYYNKILNSFDTCKNRYIASVENGKKGGRKPKKNPQVNPDKNPQVNPQGEADKTKQNKTIKEDYILSVEQKYQQPLRDWLSYRKKLTEEKQWEFQYKALKKTRDPVAAVEYSIGQGYTGLYEPKEQKKTSSNRWGMKL